MCIRDRGLPFRNGTVRDLAREAVKIAVAGLQRRAMRNRHGVDESRFLDELIEICLLYTSRCV